LHLLLGPCGSQLAHAFATGLPETMIFSGVRSCSESSSG